MDLASGSVSEVLGKLGEFSFFSPDCSVTS